MGKTIEIVDPDNITKNWTEYSEMLDKALEYNDGSHTLSGILTGLLLGKYKLIVCKEEKVNSISVIEFINYPKKRVCNIAFLYSKDVEVFKEDFISFVISYAKLSQADSVQCYGRKGWKRFLANFDFKEIYTVLERNI